MSYEILCLDSTGAQVLFKKAKIYEASQLALAFSDAEKLKQALLPRMPAAGLAGPQIGIGRAVFVYSYDRSTEHLEIVINPEIAELSKDTIGGWEACFSAMYADGSVAAAYVQRHVWMRVRYLSSKGEAVDRKIHGFAARVFQHEFDHLQGITNVNRKGVHLKKFEDSHSFEAFLKMVKEEDSKHYTNPKN